MVALCSHCGDFLMAIQPKILCLSNFKGSQSWIFEVGGGFRFFIALTEASVIGGWSKGCGPLLLMNLFFPAVFTN